MDGKARELFFRAVSLPHWNPIKGAWKRRVILEWGVRNRSDWNTILENGVPDRQIEIIWDCAEEITVALLKDREEKEEGGGSISLTDSLKWLLRKGLRMERTREPISMKKCMHIDITIFPVITKKIRAAPSKNYPPKNGYRTPSLLPLHSFLLPNVVNISLIRRQRVRKEEGVR